VTMFLLTFPTDLGQDELSTRVTLTLLLHLRRDITNFVHERMLQGTWLVSPCGDPLRDCHPNGALGQSSRWQVISKWALPADVMDYGLFGFSKKNLFFGSNIGQPCHLCVPVFRRRSMQCLPVKTDFC